MDSTTIYLAKFSVQRLLFYFRSPNDRSIHYSWGVSVPEVDERRVSYVLVRNGTIPALMPYPIGHVSPLGCIIDIPVYLFC